MTDRKWQVGKVQIILHSGSRLLKVLVIVLIVFSTAALSALWWVQTDIQKRTENIRVEASALQYRNQVLTAKLADMDSLAGIQDIAREELGMVNPDTVLFQMQSSN